MSSRRTNVLLAVKLWELDKQMLTVTRILVVLFGSLIVAAFLLHIYDPGLGYSTPHDPTRKQAIADGILPFVYTIFSFLSPSTTFRKFPLCFCVFPVLVTSS